VTSNGAWVVSDVDGTLIDADQHVIKRNVDAVQRLEDAGGQLILASGRIEASIRRYYEAFDLRSPAILYNGARVVDEGLRRVLFCRALTDEQTTALQRLFADEHAQVVPILYADGAAFSDRRGAVLRAYERKDSLTVRPMADWIALGAPAATKLLCIAPPSQMGALSASLANLVPKATLVRSETTYLEVLPEEVNKGAALRWLMDAHGMDPGRVVSVGDNLNDLELLAAAGCGVAVGDGHPDLQRRADLVVGPCGGGAVAEVVDLVLSGRLASL
jgi:Cof subfamily protein (haloacid dehalogenase superfamily)